MGELAVGNVMVDELPGVASWLTAMAVESLASYFADGQVSGMRNWTEELRSTTTTTELEEVQGMRRVVASDKKGCKSRERQREREMYVWVGKLDMMSFHVSCNNSR